MTSPGRQTQPQVTLQGLTIRADGRQVLTNLNLDFQAGQTHVVIGPSGSGKTTLLRSINRLNELFPGYSMDGEVLIPWSGKQRAVYGDSYALEELRRRVGMVFQNPNVMPVSIRRNFSIPLAAVLDCNPRETEERLTWALNEVGLGAEVLHRLDESALRLSGGQQQRLCLARALAMEPSVLLLDEPTANLDFRATAKIEELMDRLKSRFVLLVVSHNLDQAARIADRLVVLNEGQVVLDQEVKPEWRQVKLRETVAGLACFQKY